MSFSMISFLLGLAGISTAVAIIAAMILGGGFLWGVLSFLKSPLGLLVIGACLYLGGNLIGYHRGYGDMAAICEAQKRASEAAAKKMDSEIAAKAATERAAQEQEEAARVADFERRIKGYEEQLEAAGGDACRATDSDVDERMRDDGPGDLSGAVPIPADSLVDRPAPIPRARAPQRR